MKTIVVGYDDTAESRRALSRAAELARALDAKVVVTSVAPLLVGALASRGLTGIDPADSPELHREELSRAAELLRREGVKRTEYALAVGDTPTEILELAESHDADLIVVGARERNLLGRLLEPSVSGAVQRRAHRDVLIVH
jgi:nucleotide-binding universal stress UspA family protein